MAYNKVVYDGQTLIDLTQDDVTASDVRSGVYFHDASGVRSQGTLNLLDMFYPVGSYYETSDTSFDPNVAWSGSTWVLETEGQVHVSGSPSGTYQVNGATTDTTDGGASTVKLTASQSGVPAHSHENTIKAKTPQFNHTINTTNSNANFIGAGTHTSIGDAGASGTTYTYKQISIPAHSATDCTMSGSVSNNTATDATSAHNNMQPYIIVNRWHRTA